MARLRFQIDDQSKFLPINRFLWTVAIPNTNIMCVLLLQDPLLDTNQYVRAEMLALEREQRQIDERAAHVEWELRNTMDKGNTVTQ